jgi:alkanesulfonate monooxygenase SsuD/methylene tetrahydromethanopterin reductase-like flavin-dependent oxidoreductase (luciferase family)
VSHERRASEVRASKARSEPQASEVQRRAWGIEGLALGISLGGPASAREWQNQLQWVERAEALGLHSVWLPEMHFARGASSSPLLALGGFAAHSQRLRLGTTSLLLPIHHPLRMAEEVALLDTLSGGRVILGLGRGFRAPLFSAFGIDPSSKRDRFDFALDLMLDAWAGRPVSLATSGFETAFRGEQLCAPPPLQKPHPPLAVAAFGRKGLHQAARRGLPYLASPVEDLDLLAENYSFHGDNLPPEVDATALVVPVMRTLHVASDDREAARVAGAIEAETRALRGGGGGRVPAALARAAKAPALDRAIVGGVAEVIDRVAAYRERLGMDLLIVRPLIAAASDEQREASLARLVEEVLPAVS